MFDPLNGGRPAASMLPASPFDADLIGHARTPQLVASSSRPSRTDRDADLRARLARHEAGDRRRAQVAEQQLRARLEAHLAEERREHRARVRRSNAAHQAMVRAERRALATDPQAPAHLRDAALLEIAQELAPLGERWKYDPLHGPIAETWREAREGRAAGKRTAPRSSRATDADLRARLARLEGQTRRSGKYEARR